MTAQANVQRGYTMTTRLSGPVSEVRSRVEGALRQQGFGILTEIDVAATLKTRLGVELEPYLILGACNPPLAHRALEAEPSIGVLLPCNVVLREHEGRTDVEIMDPRAAMSVVENPVIGALAEDARVRLLLVLDALKP